MLASRFRRRREIIGIYGGAGGVSVLLGLYPGVPAARAFLVCSDTHYRRSDVRMARHK